MKHIATFILAFALGIGTANAQKQTFNLPAFFSTNVYFFDNTNIPVHLRIGGSAVSNVQDWATLAAVTNVSLGGHSITNVDDIAFDLTPTGTVGVGVMQWSPDMETVKLGLDANVSLDIGQQQVALVKNAESVTISNGTVVYISGATGDKASVKIASYSNDTLSARTIGIAAEDIASGGTGFVVTRGPVYAQDTSAFAAGAMLYLGAYGNVTTNRPSAPLHGVFVGVVEKVNANAGVIYVAVQNGFELDELHDVNVAATPATNSALIYNGTVWTNSATTFLPLVGGTMSGPINMNDQELNLVNQINYTTEFYIAPSSGEFGGTSPWNFTQQPTIPGYINTNNLSTIAGSGLDVVSNQLVVTNVPSNASTWSGFSATQDVAMATNGITQIETLTFTPITGTTKGQGTLFVSTNLVGDYVVNFRSGFGAPEPLYGPWNFNPSIYLTITAAEANYWRITTAPTGATSSGISGQMAVSGTNLYIYSPNALGTGTARWLRVSGEAAW